MRGSAAFRGLLLAAGWLLCSGAWASQSLSEPPSPSSGTAALDEKDAERLFLAYINDPRNLIRSCMFLGGVRIEEISVKKDLATARIRYRIECTQEEITMPPLTRTMRENFLYRNLGEHWEILGRSAELSPAQTKGGTEAEHPPPGSEGPLDPLDEERRLLAQEVVAWAVLGRSPGGEAGRFPGAAGIAWKPPILVSAENLGKGADLEVPGLEVIVLEPQALFQRTMMAQGGTWIRFEALEVHEGTAMVRVSFVSPVLPPPRPGDARTRVLSRVEVDFLRSGNAWIPSRSRGAE